MTTTIVLAAVTHWAVPAMSEVMRLPDKTPEDGVRGGTVTIIAAKDEYEPGSFVVRSDEDLGKVRFELEEFKQVKKTGEGEEKETGVVFPKANLDLKFVKVWYQNRNAWFCYFGDTGFKLCPELLVNDEDLIRVDEDKVANYARLVDADGRVRERWINPPRQMSKNREGREWKRSWQLDANFLSMSPEFRDAESLRPVSLGVGEAKQFFLTAHVAKDQPEGVYRGKVSMKRVVDGSALGEIPVAIRVLPFALPAPCTYADPSRQMAIASYHYLEMRGILGRNGGDRALGVRQLERILADQVAHGQTMHMLKPDVDGKDGEALMTVGLMKKVGMRTDELIALASAYTFPRKPMEYGPLHSNAVAKAASFRRAFGHCNVYLSFGDEPKGNWFMRVRPFFEAYHDAGFGFFLAGDGNMFSRGSEFVDWANLAEWPENAQPTAKWNSLAGNRVAWYGKMHVGPENPAFNRRQYGMAPYLSGYTALCNYAHHLGPYNDDTTIYRPMVFAYGVHGGVMDTIQWEGFREGVDDMRYATLVMRLAKRAEASDDPATVRLGRRAKRLLAMFDASSGDMAALRLEMTRYIQQLRAKVGDVALDAPPKAIDADADALIAKYDTGVPVKPTMDLSDDALRETVRVALESGCADATNANERVAKLEEAGCCANWLGDEESVRRLWKMRQEIAKPWPRRVMEVPYSEVPIRTAESWAKLSVSVDAQPLDRAFSCWLDVLVTDVGTGRGDVSGGGAAASKPMFSAACDEWGVHLRFVERMANVRAIELCAEKGGLLEMYFAPGADAPHAAFLVDVAPGGKATVYNAQYETFGVRRVRDDARHFRSQIVFDGDRVETHVSVAWENYAGRLPTDGDEWEFEALRWSGSGNAAWNGTESIHGRSTWGRLKFRIPPAARNAIRRRQICAAAAAYRREKAVEQHYDGSLSWWEDPHVGDAVFYEKSLAPFVARLDALAERAKPEMSDAEVASFSDADLSALLDVRFEVSRRRHDWLEARVCGAGK